MQHKDLKDFRAGMNKDDRPEELQPGEYTDAINMRTGSSKDQQSVGIAETLQGEVELLLGVSADITYYGEAIGGEFIYEGFDEVQIGTQVWMRRNWDADYPGSKSYNNNDNNEVIFGRLYSHKQISQPDFCPPGWRVPTEADADELLNYLGGLLIAGGKLKEVGTDRWNSPNTGATDSSGFRALPGGTFDSVFDLLFEMGFFWLADEGEPVAPTAVNPINITTTSFVAKWEVLLGVTEYRLDVSTDNFATFVPGYEDKNVGNTNNALVEGLDPDVDYSYRVRAINEVGTSNNSNTVAVKTFPVVSDDIVIGTQTWMKRNIDADIPTSRVYDDDEDNRDIYGGLYSFDLIAAIEALYPGYHVPTKAEWETLRDYLGGGLVAGSHLKEAGTTHWDIENGDNLSGFTALPGGECTVWNQFLSITTAAYFWSATEKDIDNSWAVVLAHDQPNMYIAQNPKGDHYSIRLIKD